jgi:D-aminopeptidase
LRRRRDRHGSLGFKAGIGTSSRLAVTAHGITTVGVLVQANFSGRLRVDGVPVSRERVGVPDPGPGPEPAGNSCVIVVATDALLDARQLSRLARRAVFAMGRVGSDFTGSSGDYAIAFTTAAVNGSTLPDAGLEPLFSAVLESTEEALLNSLFMARTTVGYLGHTRYAVPHDRLLALVRSHGLGPTP